MLGVHLTEDEGRKGAPKRDTDQGIYWASETLPTGRIALRAAGHCLVVVLRLRIPSGHSTAIDGMAPQRLAICLEVKTFAMTQWCSRSSPRMRSSYITVSRLCFHHIDVRDTVLRLEHRMWSAACNTQLASCQAPVRSLAKRSRVAKLVYGAYKRSRRLTVGSIASPIARPSSAAFRDVWKHLDRVQK
jgi:hypothetical protein